MKWGHVMRVGTLARFANDISDEFQSTFTVVDDNILVNILSLEDLPIVSKIIRKYIPNAQVKFERTFNRAGEFDIYVIRLNRNRFD